MWYRGGNIGAHIVRVWGFSITQAYISGFLFFWSRRTLGCWVWGPSGNLLKEQGSYNLVQYWEHRGPVLKPRCIGPGEGPYPIYHSTLKAWYRTILSALLLQLQDVLGAFANLRKATFRFIRSFCPSARKKPRLPMDGFSRNLIWVFF